MEEKKYECFLKADTYLPMMYMPDAIRATIELMEAPASKISVRTSYNISGMSFSPKEIAEEISKQVPGFNISSVARNDWGWKEEYDLVGMTTDMFQNLEK
jgi:nucleoside-diphosphate-sugar epimerase